MASNNKNLALGMLLAVYVASFVDRQILALLLQPIKDEFYLSDTQLGFLSGIAFAVFYATLGVPIARMADRGNRVSIVSGCLAIWSGATALCGVTSNFWQLLLARIGVGIGEAGCTPPSHSILSDYFYKAELTRAMSIYMLGVPFGFLIGYLIGGWVNEIYGWRAAFLTMGLPGIVLSVTVKLTIADPERVSGVRVLPTEVETSSIWLVFHTLWHRKSFRHLILAMALTAFLGYGMGQWVPAFFIRSHGLETGELGTWLALMIGIFGALGIYFGGSLTERIGADNDRLKLWVIAGTIGVTLPLSVLSFSISYTKAALILMAPTYLFYFMWHGPAYAFVQRLADQGMRSTAAAIALLIINLIGLGLGPQFVGLLSDLFSARYGESTGLRLSLIVNSCIALWAAMHYVLAGRHIVDDIERVKNAAEFLPEGGCK